MTAFLQCKRCFWHLCMGSNSVISDMRIVEIVLKGVAEGVQLHPWLGMYVLYMCTP